MSESYWKSSFFGDFKGSNSFSIVNPEWKWGKSYSCSKEILLISVHSSCRLKFKKKFWSSIFEKSDSNTSKFNF